MLNFGELFGGLFKDSTNNITNNIDELIKKYGELNIAESAHQMALDNIGKAEAEAMLNRQGYDAATIKATLDTEYNTEATKENNIVKDQQVVAENNDESATKKNTVATQAETKAIRDNTNAIRDNNTVKVSQTTTNAVTNIPITSSDTTNIQATTNSISGIAGAVATSSNGFKNLVTNIKNLSIWGKAANVVLSALKTSLIAFGLGLAIKGISSFVKQQKELIQTTKESAEELGRTNDSVNDYVEKYNDLYNALIKAKGNEEETLRVKENLLELQKELNEEFGDAYGRINLVTDAYKDMSSAIEDVSKKENQRWLNQNREGFNQSFEEMTKTRHDYIGLNISSSTDAGQDIRDIANQIEGLDVVAGGIDGTYSIKVNANVEDADKAVNEFMTEVNKAMSKYDQNDEGYNIFDNVLDMSNDALNRFEGIMDDFSETYYRGLLAEIDTDGNLSNLYDQAIDAVEAYNEAVLKSEDPYNDKNVQSARKNLKSIQDQISSNSDEWGRYSSVMDDVFDDADTRLYDFNQELQNDSSLQSALSDIKGVTDTELEAIEDAIDSGENNIDELSPDQLKIQNAWNIIKQAADKYGLSVDEIISGLVNLKYVQSTVAEESAETPKLSYGDTISELEKYTKALDALDEVYAKFADGDKKTNITFDDLSSINEEFKDIEGIDGYIKAIQEAQGDTEATQQAFNDLATAYINHIGILDEVTEENKDLIASMLEERGIANANELVQIGLARSKAESAWASRDLSDATAEEITALADESGAIGEAREAFIAYIVQKMLAANPISTQGDLEALNNVIQGLGLATNAWKKYYETKAEILSIENSKQVVGKSGTVYYESEDGSRRTTQEALDEKISANEAEMQKYLAELKKIGTDAIYSGGNATKKASSGGKDVNPTEFDSAAESVANLNTELERLNTLLENEDSYSKKLPILEELIAKQKEYNSALAAQEQTYRNEYANALAALPEEWQTRVAGSETFSIDIVPEDLKDAVQYAQDYRDKWNDVRQEILSSNEKLKDLKQTQNDLAQAKLDNIIGSLENDITDIQNQIDEAESMGLNATQAQYEQMISKSGDLIDQYEEKLRGLYIELNNLKLTGETDSDRYYKVADAIQECEDSISQCRQNQNEWNKAILELPIEYIEKANDKLNDQLSDLENQQSNYDSAINGVVSHLQDLIDAQEELKEQAEEAAQAQIDAAQEQIDALQDQLDALQKTNDERKQQLELEQAQYNLERARNQKTTRIYREGQGFVYEADQDAIRDAQDAYDDAVYNKQVSDIEDQMDELQDKIEEIEKSRDELLETYDEEINRLQEIMDSWNGIVDAIQKAKDMAMADDILGKGWQDRVPGGDTSDIDNMTGKYEQNDKKQTWVEKQIEDNNKLIDSVNEYIEAWQQGEISIREARESINDIVGDYLPEIEANDERVRSVTGYKNQWSAASIAIPAGMAIIQAVIGNNADELAAVEARRAAAQAYSDQWASNVLSIDTSLKTITTANQQAMTDEKGYLVQRQLNLQDFATKYELLADRISKMCDDIVDSCREAEDALNDLHTAEGYAKGTRNATPGLHPVAEKNKPEIIIKNDGTPVVAEKETLYPFAGGETVLDANKTKDILNGKNLVKLEPNQSLFSEKQMNVFSSLAKNITPNNIASKMISFDRPVFNTDTKDSKQGDVNIQISNISLPEVRDSDTFAKAITDGSLKTAIQQRLYKNK